MGHATVRKIAGLQARGLQTHLAPSELHLNGEFPFQDARFVDDTSAEEREIGDQTARLPLNQPWNFCLVTANSSAIFESILVQAVAIQNLPDPLLGG